MYSPQLLDHFQNPRHPGEVENPDVTIEVENPVCGDILRFTAKVADGRIVDIKFKAKGCVPAMACGSALAELVRGRTVEVARELKITELIHKVGGLPQASSHAGQLAIDALGLLLKTLR